jgi:lipoprotein NlpD
MNRIHALLLVTVLAGCSSSSYRAPVSDRGEIAKKSTITADAARKKAQRESDWRPQVHIVQKGETLYGIALNYGFGYRELADLNGIQSPFVISIGQEIRLFPAGVAPAAPPVAVEVRPLEPKPIETLLKEQPKLAKYAYSDEAMVQIEKVQNPAKPEVTAVAKTDSKPKQEPKPEAADTTADDGVEDALEWSMPTKGKLVGEFSEAANRKGVDIAGKLGQPVTASAPGKVVYSGTGLRGYGKLIIIKHNKTYLSAYAHNDQLLVKEGQSVTRGQKIAEMGSSDASQVMLHFEVRRFGKPVDPAKYLPLGKS